ncbi:MAG: hypothetical protein K0Q83_4108 [Deltaproteobacteria bacterium]|jgi:hypothetical protein|nr:hypothetical protein [Deltaproteobacteria bacterium]
MNRSAATLFSALIVIFLLACNSARIDIGQGSFTSQSNETIREFSEPRISFEDRTEELVGHAERLIAKNEKEGAVLDQRWYTFKRFGQYQDTIFSASQIVFYGGLEDDVRANLPKHYESVVPLEKDQEPGEIRLFSAKHAPAQHDLIIIGQNGREVALKTIIRLIYLAGFTDPERERKYRDKLHSFKKSLKVFMSSRSARQEFIDFFAKHGVSSPDTVMIGFIGDTRSLLKAEGIHDPELYSDESLRVNWFKNANGRKVLLVSIDHNRIYASRSGELIEAILAISGSSPPKIVFLGSAGAIEDPSIVGRIVTPTMVLNGDPFPAVQHRGVLVHLIRNKAVAQGRIKTAHASVENVVVETTQWAGRMKRDRVTTVDQELFHIMKAVNSRDSTQKVEIYVGILVTDNVSSSADANTDITLEHAEEAIAKTSSTRREFLRSILTDLRLLKRDDLKSPQQKAIGY